MCSLDCILSLPEWEEWTLLLICLNKTTASLCYYSWLVGSGAWVTLSDLFINSHLTLWLLGLTIFLLSEIHDGFCIRNVVWEEQTWWNTLEVATFGTEAGIRALPGVLGLFCDNGEWINSFFGASSPVFCANQSVTFLYLHGNHFDPTVRLQFTLVRGKQRERLIL